MKENIISRLETDPGHLTLGQLFQEREAARIEIDRLMKELETLKAKMIARPLGKSVSLDKKEQPSYTDKVLIGIGDLCKQIGVSRATIYRWMHDNAFPSPVRISPGAIRWRSEDIEAWRSSLQMSG